MLLIFADTPTLHLLASVKVSMNAGGVEVGNAMDGSDVVHTWVVTTNFAGEKKQIADFYINQGQVRGETLLGTNRNKTFCGKLVFCGTPIHLE